jgi:hypothetical protein
MLRRNPYSHLSATIGSTCVAIQTNHGIRGRARHPNRIGGQSHPVRIAADSKRRQRMHAAHNTLGNSIPNSGRLGELAFVCAPKGTALANKARNMVIDRGCLWVFTRSMLDFR